ncbi:hypothetical protein CTI12_AA076950 [Artemisia annua]|uniref:Uncharacterized protein n=1 Tax=Artemisia annua TaxID=35608 RepID=A0A2U1Q4C8_ARTAN|nr:hypothetical protein CTI12_AA076950 [Artemisia annua]
MKRLDKKAAANYPESVDPHDYPAKSNALYQSVADLKPENVKPYSQPETLDERIEMQKGKQEIDMASFTGVTTPGKRTMQRRRSCNIVYLVETIKASNPQHVKA